MADSTATTAGDPIAGAPTPALSSGSGSVSPLNIEEVLVEIVSYLDRQSLHSCVTVSKKFYRAAIRSLWKVVHWKGTTADNCFLPEFIRYGHYTVELQDNFNADLELIARICTNLRELRLAWTPPTDESLQRILESSPKISHLYLYCGRALTHQAFQSISQLAGLRRLDLRNMIKMTDGALITLLRSCPLLEHLNLEDVLLENIFLDDLGDKPLRLRILGLARSYLPGTFVKNLLSVSPEIKEVSLARNTRTILTKEDILPLQDILSQLTYLNLDSCRLIESDAMETLFGTCPNLERVNIGSTMADDRCLNALSTNCCRLQNLNLSWCNHITDEGVINFLTTCTTLKLLDIRTLGTISSAIFHPKKLWACRDLETLNITGVYMARPSIAAFGGGTAANHARMFEQLGRLRSLRDLVLGGSTLTLELSSGMSKLGELEDLESFRIASLEVILAEDEIRWIVDSWPKLKRIKFESGTLPPPWKRYFRHQRPQLILG
ncbi:hypothetical protein EMPS_02470 [Entomortierella parvispora]|uniref:F-box domain-containing protein n=1 Tax=Entomortierella parvispora TaxID=205924 RepID=A0A9P3LTI0_9FUNG|nr:hypothetical protein EMPS_02470 [Entomortierella parvispora]